MDQKQRQLLIASALVIATVLIWGKTLFFGGAAGKRGATSKPAESDAVVGDFSFFNVVRESESVRRSQEAVWVSSWGRDPFLPAGAMSGGGAQNFTLSGIVWDEKMPIAIINQHVLKKGDEISSCKVIDIKPNSVVLASGDESFELPLFQSPTAGETNKTSSAGGSSI